MIWPSFELPHQDDSDEGSRHTVSMISKKTIPQLSSKTPSIKSFVVDLHSHEEVPHAICAL